MEQLSPPILTSNEKNVAPIFDGLNRRVTELLTNKKLTDTLVEKGVTMNNWVQHSTLPKKPATSLPRIPSN